MSPRGSSPNKPRKRRQRRIDRVLSPARRRVERGEDRGRIPAPVPGLDVEPSATLPRQCVRLRLTIVLGGAPGRGSPPPLLEAVERGIERALTDGQRVAGGLLDPSGDGIAVRRPPAQCLEDEQVEGASQNVRA